MTTPTTKSRLNLGAQVTLSASGHGIITLGPDAAKGPANWHIDGVIVQTTRPGLAPIPRVQVYLDEASLSNSQGLSYDGSFAQGACDLTISRGSAIVAEWTGGQAGDVAYLTLTGEKW